jgi:hypothetical protein
MRALNIYQRAAFCTILCACLFACGTKTEKTTTIIREHDVPKQTSGIEFKIKGSESGISVETN